MLIICYARKSTEKSDESIENQFSIINKYLKAQKDFKSAEIIYMFDNESGIDLNRTAFQDVLLKVRQRQVDVIIVKDFSRLSRNYLDVCKLTDSIFPFMNVRFISVLDKYDSKYNIQENSVYFSKAFMAIINEYYVFETSKKVRNSCIQRTKNGEFLGAISYGYKLKNKSTIEIVEEQAEIVREIFQLFINGTAIVQITKSLNDRNIQRDNKKKWTVNTVRKILKNEQYIGKKIGFKYKRDVKSKKYIPTSQSEWYVNEQAFPPIIEKDVFHKAKSILEDNRKKVKSNNFKNQGIMSRKVYCQNCGMTLRKIGNELCCPQKDRTGAEPCFTGKLKIDKLSSDILKEVKSFILEDLLDFNLNFSFSDKREISSSIDNLKEEKAKIFDSFFSNSISKEEFDKANKEISLRISELQYKLEKCQKALTLNTSYNSERLIETLQRLYNSNELNLEHMQFVHQINVYNTDKYEIVMQPYSALAVLCRNMDIYKEETF